MTKMKDGAKNQKARNYLKLRANLVAGARNCLNLLLSVKDMEIGATAS